MQQGPSAGQSSPRKVAEEGGSMKAIPLLLAMVLLVSFSFLTFAQDKYVPTPNEQLFGTWRSASMSPQKTMHFLGGYKDFALINDTNPAAEDKEEIVAKWTDSDGNICYKTLSTAASGSWAGSTVLTVQRISKSGTVKESVSRRLFSDYNPRIEVLMEIDPSDYTYRIYYREEK
jgi:hypothetical protein